jgi:hypothetical protein
LLTAKSLLLFNGKLPTEKGKRYFEPQTKNGFEPLTAISLS